MNINFFEKKKVNILPYIAGGIFVFLLLMMGLYFFIVRTNYTKTIEESNQWMTANAEEVSLSREISELDQGYNQAVSAQQALIESQYPLYTLVNDLASLIPNELDRVSSFQMIGPDQVTLILEGTETTMGQTVVEAIEERPYVTQVQILRAQVQNEEETEFEFELIIDIDADAIEEEATE